MPKTIEPKKPENKANGIKGEARANYPSCVTENSLKNLELGRWQAGQSGNPNGRPKGRKTGLRARLLRELEKTGDLKIINFLKTKGVNLEVGDAAEVIAAVASSKAQRGDKEMIKFMADQTEAPLPKDLNINGEMKFTRIERIVISPTDKPKELNEKN